MDEDIGEEDFLVGLENELMADGDSEQINALNEPQGTNSCPLNNTVQNEHGDDIQPDDYDDSTENEDEFETKLKPQNDRNDESIEEEEEDIMIVDINADLIEEINALKEKILEKERVCSGSLNLILKKRFEDVVKVLKSELQLKIARMK